MKKCNQVIILLSECSTTPKSNPYQLVYLYCKLDTYSFKPYVTYVHVCVVQSGSVYGGAEAQLGGLLSYEGIRVRRIHSVSDGEKSVELHFLQRVHLHARRLPPTARGQAGGGGEALPR